MGYLYTRSTDGLRVLDQRSGDVVYAGKPQGHPVKQIMPVPNSDDCIVLLDYGGGPSVFQNVLRLRPSGEQVWAADLPQPSGPDAYVSVEWDKKAGLTASSWSGYWVTLDPHSGRIKEAEFVK